MLKGWSSFPVLHKKRFFQGVGAYACLVLILGGWIVASKESTLKAWDKKVPHAEAQIRTVFLTPQLLEQEEMAFDASLPLITAGEASVSLVMTGLGLSSATTERAIEDLPTPIGLAFSPYGTNLQAQVSQAADAGHETFVLLPMEPHTYPNDDPGPRSLLTRLSEKENMDNLDWALNQAGKVTGVLNYMGSRFMMDETNLSSVFSLLRQRNSIFIEQPTGTVTLAEDVAGRAKLPHIAADLEIDANAAEREIHQQLLKLEKIAAERGYALGVIQPYPVSFNLVKAWADTLDNKNIKLVPPATLYKSKRAHEKRDRQSTPDAPG